MDTGSPLHILNDKEMFCSPPTLADGVKFGPSHFSVAGCGRAAFAVNGGSLKGLGFRV